MKYIWAKRCFSKRPFPLVPPRESWPDTFPFQLGRYASEHLVPLGWKNKG